MTLIECITIIHFEEDSPQITFNPSFFERTISRRSLPKETRNAKFPTMLMHIMVISPNYQ